MAAAGLLADRAFTLHWEYAGATVETFPDARLTRARYVTDGDRLTCGGGVAPLEMAHALIAERMGEAFARRVSDWFLHTAIGAADDPQRASAVERYGIRHPALLAVLETMEKTVEAPLGRQAMARLVSISPRHLDRLFLEKRGLSFSTQYRAIRLAHGRRLLRQSPLRIGEVATACGFFERGPFRAQLPVSVRLQPILGALKHAGTIPPDFIAGAVGTSGAGSVAPGWREVEPFENCYSPLPNID